jgi:hypothetical protein
MAVGSLRRAVAKEATELTLVTPSGLRCGLLSTEMSSLTFRKTFMCTI